jgi:hypothetical protein
LESPLALRFGQARAGRVDFRQKLRVELRSGSPSSGGGDG